ncbi:dihydropteroate synthase Sul [Paenibacillus larvae subsp. larvae]|uniref:Dihydropteroate synthase n=2 Tax=Paenibacillus larvae TaxID=1464 RepID=A0A2L1TUY5_9BACL|nr:dihydropteroate synthase Sul [Paenibacillus larvae subsp. larvae]
MTAIAYQDKKLEFGERTLIMGILNVTPDSFSDGGNYIQLDQAVLRAKQMVEEGADIIDIGGESTRPDSKEVSLEEELRRIISVIERLSKEVSVPLSVDTYKAEVARQCLEAGAHLINDVWGARKEPEMAEVAARYGCPIVLMHNRTEIDYTDFVHDVLSDLKETVRLAKQAGVKDEQIILDPGIGFAKTREHNLQLMNYLTEIRQLGYPVLLGTSRKSMIWKTLDLAPTDVVEGTAATVTLGIYQGCEIMRVHDVKEMRRVADMTDAIVKHRNNK